MVVEVVEVEHIASSQLPHQQLHILFPLVQKELVSLVELEVPEEILGSAVMMLQDVSLKVESAVKQLQVLVDQREVEVLLLVDSEMSSSMAGGANVDAILPPGREVVVDRLPATPPTETTPGPKARSLPLAIRLLLAATTAEMAVQQAQTVGMLRALQVVAAGLETVQTALVAAVVMV